VSRPLVSVIVPCFNAERWISETLDSVFTQTWQPIEVIVVDDGSRDRSVSLVRSKTFAKLKLVTQENRGQTSALNRGLLEAQGDFIQYLDADDVLHPSKIELQMRRIVDDPTAVATAEWGRFSDKPAAAQFTPDATWTDLDSVSFLVESWRDGAGMMMPGLWLCSRQIVERAGPWREDLTLNNDAEYFCRIVLSARRVLFCPGARVYYRSGLPGSLSSHKTAASFQSNFKVLEACQRHLLAVEDSDRTRRSLSMRWQLLAHVSYPYAPAFANRCLALGLKLHAERLPPNGGPTFNLVSKVAGWKVARRLQKWSGGQ
jgi:glycosyltransferase involved in cell wall biosynthesis